MMATTVFCFILFVICITRCDCEKCIDQTESGREKKVCCADYEAKHNDCIACPKGYTSYAGQKCRQCQDNTFGERCQYDCSCSVFEVCNIVDGCVKLETTTGILVDDTSEHSIYTMYTGTKQTSTIEEYEQLSRKIITYYTLSLTGTVLGIWLCFLFYKYKTLPIKTKAILFNSTTRALQQSRQDIEMQGSS